MMVGKWNNDLTGTVTTNWEPPLRHLVSAWITLAVLCIAGPAMAQISDDFSAQQLNDTLWQLTDSRGDGQLVLDPGLITLSVPAGQPHDAGPTDNHTLRLLQDLPDVDFTLEARFESVPNVRGQQQGLMVLENPGTYVHLFHHYDGQQLQLRWARVINHQIYEHGALTTVASDTLAVRLARLGNQWTCEQAVDGGPWTTGFVFTHAIKVSQGGVYAANTQPTDWDNPYDRDNPPVNKSGSSTIAPAFAAVIDCFFDSNNPVIPEDGTVPGGTRTFTGLEAFYMFREGSADVVFDYAGTADPYHLTEMDSGAVTWLPGHGLSFDTPTLVTATRPATTLNEAIVTAGAVTFEAWLDPSTTVQSGPARIMTLSADPSNRNLTLSHGQWGSLPSDVFDVRLRTTEQSLNGQPDLVSPAGSLSGSLQHVVYTRDALGVARIYVDGSEAVNGVAEGDLSNWDPTYALAIGGEMDATRNWLGSLYLAAVYSRALDASEVAENFGAGPDGGIMPLLAPAVILQDVAPGAMFDFTETIPISAAAKDADGTIVAVEFRVGGNTLYRDETAPYHFDWLNPTVGGHQIQAVAFDNDGLETASAIVPINVSVPASYQQALTISDAFFDADLGAPWVLTDTSGGAGTTQNNGSVYLNLPATIQSPWDPSGLVLRAHQDEVDADLALELMIDSDAWTGDGFTGLEVADSLGATVRFVASRSGSTWDLSWGAAAIGAPSQLGSTTLGAISGPLWLQLRRQGETCELSTSADGLVWQQTATIGQPLAMNRAGWLAGALDGAATVVLDHVFNLAAPIVPEDGQSGDHTGPVISQVIATTEHNQLTVDWVTDEMAYYRLQYGLTSAYELGLIEAGFFSQNHQAVLSGLTTGMPYHMQLTCLDNAGNVTVSEDLVFHTDLDATAAAGPMAGNVYRETVFGFGSGTNDWRVTDPDALSPGAAEFLPNAVLTLNVPDLTGATRAELVIDRWGGHPGTTGKKIRLNGGSWIHLGEPATIPDSQPECYVYQDNPMINLPLAQLASGPITLEGSADEQSCFSFDWGQWGWYGVVLRVYYDGSVAHPDGSFLAPLTGTAITDSVAISVAVSSTGVVDTMHVFARYEGFDGDGDGVTNGWHRRYRRNLPDATLNLEGHVGTVDAAPWTVTWDASWVPDQAPGTVALQARVRDDSGVWYVTEVDNLSLDHSDGVIKAYPMLDVGRAFWVRDGESKSTTFNIPATDTLALAAEALLTANTWNGLDEGVIEINGATVGFEFGRHHFFSSDTFDISTGVLDPGINTLTISSVSPDHGLEMLWPGPLLKVRYGAAPPVVTAAQPGDVNGDGEQDHEDARLVLRHVVQATTLSGARQILADVDGNGSVETADAALIMGQPAKTAQSSTPSRITATSDPNNPHQVIIGLEHLVGLHSVELTVVAENLEPNIQRFHLSAEGLNPVAWHSSGDTLRLAQVGLIATPELCTLELLASLGELTINAKVDGQALEAVTLTTSDLPTRFELVGNYPNPFNPTTTIAFNLPRSASVRLRIFDVRGRVVATVVEESLPAGRHTVLWDGRDQQGRATASGTFFYRLETGGQVWTRKMLLLK